MSLLEKLITACRVPPGKQSRLKRFPARWKPSGDLSKAELKQLAEESLAAGIAALADAQNLLYASDTWSVLVIFQALDAAGKDGTIKHVLTGINPQGCQVHSFKQPSSEELDHDFLWRTAKALPERGRIGIFNRSYYEEVLVVRVNPELVAKQRIPGAKPQKEKFWRHRFDDINHFERHLVRNGTHLVKFFLNISKAEQKRRFLERIDDPKKHWKFSPDDVAEREHWDEYMRAYEAMLNATSTKYAPWYVVPADDKPLMRAAVAAILTREIKSLDLSYPTPSKAIREALAESRRKLLAE